MEKIALRTYLEEKRKGRYKTEISLKHGRIFVFDTETTNDKYQNLKFGSFRIYNRKILEKIGIFYDKNTVSKKEMKILEKAGFHLYERKEFAENIFFPEVYDKKALCVGFNLPFDLSRLAIGHGYAKGSFNGGFSFKLSERKDLPRVKIKHLDNTKSFIHFGRSLKDNFRGYFLDLKTLGVTLTDDKHINLEKACEVFKTEHKKLKDVKHGKITEKYVEYNLLDVKVTYELYLKMKEELEKYGIEIPITEVYSSASLGKKCLGQLGIKPFFENNLDFLPKYLGYIMSTYYGGRSEVKIRKNPVKVTVIDFLSMYPTMFILMDLWKFVIAEKIEVVEDTENIRKFLKELKIEDLRRPEIWKKLNVIVQIIPKNDILPIRMRYGDGNALNIGVNYLSSKKPLYYTLADVVASKLLTGKSPKIKKAYRFVPKGKQKSLKKSKFLEIEIDPSKDNLFKILIEERQKCKENGENFRQKALKILANATSYGIFVEINTKSMKKGKEVKIYSNKTFTTTIKKIEKTGKYFNPIIASLITSGSRLILATTEALLEEHEEIHAFCDTDSMAINPKYVKEIQEFFKPLNPYKFDKPLFKVEKDNILFYGISSKRYVLFTKNKDKIVIKEGKDRSYSLHGLGHLNNPFGKNVEKWHKRIWEDVLKLHYNLLTREQFLRKYSNLFALSSMTASSYEIMKRFKELNREKHYEKQIKPFNFFLVGVGNKDDIKPISPFSDNPQEIVHNEFVDYKTGKSFKGLCYWKSLKDVLWNYLNHNESKFDGENSILKRKRIRADGFVYIGKESNKIEETGVLESPDYATYLNPEELLKMTYKEARERGLNEETLRQIKKRVKNGEKLVLRGKTAKKINFY